jgi:hypothetical protein
MDYMKMLEWALLSIGAASVAALGLQGALVLFAPKTATTADDKAASLLGKLAGGLRWLKGVLDALALNLKK